MSEIKPIDSYNLPDDSLQFTQAFIVNNEAILLEVSKEVYKVGLCDINNQLLKNQITALHKTQKTNSKLEFIPIEKNDLYLFLGKKGRGSDSNLSISNIKEEDDTYLDKIANDAPVINLVNSLLLQAYNEEVSDIHFDAQESFLLVRFRKDGILQPVEKIKKDLQAAVSSRIKIMAKLNIMERRKPQDGRCSVQLSGNNYDIRVSIIPTIYGESIVLRLLQKDKENTDLQVLGFSESDTVKLSSLVQQPHGLLLVTGPTGSGKTTTLHALLKKMPRSELKIISLEDPVEYQMEGISQVQINESIDLGFEACLRRVLRQDPDVIMVGEIRDKATAELSIRAGLTGHFVLSSLHTNSAIDSINRLTNLGVEPYLIAAVLRGVIGQRLVRKLCPHCKTQKSVDEVDQGFLSSLSIKLATSFYPVGCPKCGNTGYAGRVLVYEILFPTKELLKKIQSDPEGITSEMCTQYASFKPITEHAVELLTQGITSLSELKKVLLT